MASSALIGARATIHDPVVPKAAITPSEFLVGVVAFVVLATANSAGYRYGVSDQAFYIPAIIRELTPGSFPRDGALLEAQGTLTFVEETLAAICRTTGVSLPVLSAVGYVAALAGLWGAVALIGGSLYRSRWSVLALGLALTLRHRVTRTGANTLEGYFHPRMVAFALGAVAVAALLRRRPWTSMALVGGGMLVHPTTAIWFALLLGPALLVSMPSLRPLLAWLALACGIAAVAALLGPLRPRLVAMDDRWVMAFADKDYVFPTAWSLETWLLNLLLPALIFSIWRTRRRAGHTTAEETGLMAGALVLLATFLVSLPFIAGRVALAVQLQTSRVFWLLDLLATIYVVWWLVDRPSASTTASHRRQLAVAAVLATVSLARGAYIVLVEHPERGFGHVHLLASDWQEAMNWLRAQPLDVHVLADPGHAFKYETSVRIAAERDVMTEAVKDSAMALYSPSVAARVVERAHAIGDFTKLTADRAHELARQYDLDYLVTETDLPLPIAYRNQRFRIYSLDE